MTPERMQELDTSIDAKLTPEELAEGWHFCPDWDGLVVGPGCVELEGCTCKRTTDRSDKTGGE